MAKQNHQTVLFLCTGNYYRSRFAEILFNSAARKMGLPWRASSKGLALERGVGNIGPMAASAVSALKTLGVQDADAVARMPQPVTDSDLEGAHRIVALQRDEHLPLVQERLPIWTEKIEFWHVADAPELLALIEKEVMGLVARILGGGERQGETTAEPARPSKPDPPPKAITVKVGRETAGRRGKGVTTVFDAPLNDDELKQLAGVLKQRCGTGGTVRDGRIEIQGDQRERIVAELERLGYRVKRVGG